MNIEQCATEMGIRIDILFYTDQREIIRGIGKYYCHVPKLLMYSSSHLPTTS